MLIRTWKEHRAFMRECAWHNFSRQWGNIGHAYAMDIIDRAARPQLGRKNPGIVAFMKMVN